MHSGLHCMAVEIAGPFPSTGHSPQKSVPQSPACTASKLGTYALKSDLPRFRPQHQMHVLDDVSNLTLT